MRLLLICVTPVPVIPCAYGTIGVMMKPPFTKLSRYDLNAGTIRWQVGLGDDARLAVPMLLI